MMKQWLLVVSIGVGIIALSGSLWRYAEAPTAPFKVGVVLPLSGGLAEYGAAMRNGIILAQEENPAEFLHISFIFEDVSYDSGRAALAFNKLRSVDRVDLMYSLGVKLSQVIAPLAEQYRLPLMSQAIDSRIARDRHYVLRFFPPSDHYADTLVNYIRENRFQRIGIVLTEDAYLEELWDKIQARLASVTELALLDRYQMSDTDFRSTITRISHGNFDALGILLGAGQIGPFYRQVREQRLVIQTFGTNFFESSSEFQASGGGMSGAVFANNLVTEQFGKRYLARFGNTSQLTFAACSHEFAKVVGNLFSAPLAERSAANVLQAFASVKGRTSAATGSIAYYESDEVGNYFGSPVVMKQIDNDGNIRVIASPVFSGK